MLLLIAYTIIAIYNSLIKKSKLTEEAWSGVDVLLKKRYDLIPSIVDTVKAYSKHEKETLAEIVHLRNIYNQNSSIKDKAQQNNEVSQALKSIFALSENYPDLKANQSFLDLQNNLNEIEEQIQLAKRYYNATVRDYNILVEMFPSNLIANKFGFISKDFYELSREEERENIKISF